MHFLVIVKKEQPIILDVKSDILLYKLTKGTTCYLENDILYSLQNDSQKKKKDNPALHIVI